jgi:hypothetical protein
VVRTSAEVAFYSRVAVQAEQPVPVAGKTLPLQPKVEASAIPDASPVLPPHLGKVVDCKDIGVEFTAAFALATVGFDHSQLRDACTYTISRMRYPAMPTRPCMRCLSEDGSTDDADAGGWWVR